MILYIEVSITASMLLFLVHAILVLQLLLSTVEILDVTRVLQVRTRYRLLRTIVVVIAAHLIAVSITSSSTLIWVELANCCVVMH